MHLKQTTILSKAKIQQALDALFERESRSELPESEELDPFVVCSGVSMDEVLRFCNKRDSIGFRIWFRPDGHYEPNADAGLIFGDLIVVELPSTPHQMAAGAVMTDLFYHVFQAFDTQVFCYGSPLCRIGSTLKEPDGVIHPRDLRIGVNVKDSGDGNPFPNCVIEVAYKQESLKILEEELGLWISPDTSVMVAIGIKIYGLRANGKRRLVALVYRRNASVANPEQRVEFGTTEAPVTGLTINIPAADLFHGAAIPPRAVGAVATITLEELQTSILSRL